MLSPNLWSKIFPFTKRSGLGIFSGGGGGVAHPLTFDAETNNAKIQNSHFWGGGGVAHLLTFDAESKNATIQNSHFCFFFSK